MTDLERFEAAIRREVVRIVLEAKNGGGDADAAQAAAYAWVSREHRVATWTALKHRCNPIDVLSRSDKITNLTVAIIDDVVRDVYGACSC